MRPVARCALFLVAVHPALAGAHTHRVFVTSTQGSAKLSTWGADAGGQSGALAGDAICQARANAANLNPPGVFKAWLSTDANDAFCRLQGYTGEKSTNCGNQPDVPNDAGPWAIGGLPFGAKIRDLVYPSMQVYYPVIYNEFGNPASGAIWTGTFGTGEALETCDDWDSESDLQEGYSGWTHKTGVGWTASELRDCSLDARLLCLETGLGDPLPPIVFWGRLAFVTSVADTGNLGDWADAGAATGLDAADAICQSRATTAGLANPDSFKALLSDSQTNAIGRFQYDGRWIRLDRASIATSLASLADGNLEAPLNQTEQGSYLGGDLVWTASNAAGTAIPPFCDDWTDPVNGTKIWMGFAQNTDPDWLEGFFGSCDDVAHLYCLQDLPLIFGDGFESGTTTTWQMQ